MRKEGSAISVVDESSRSCASTGSGVEADAEALYAKMKGVPWNVDRDLTIADELVIGIGTAELSDSRLQERQRFVGITTVFRGDGNYLLGQLSREATYADYPQVLRDSTRLLTGA